MAEVMMNQESRIFWELAIMVVRGMELDKTSAVEICMVGSTMMSSLWVNLNA